MTTPVQNQDNAADKPVEDDDLAKTRLRLSEQAALMLMLDEILPSITYAPGQNLRNRVYNNFATLSTDSSGHIDLTKKLYRGKELAYFFKGIDPVILNTLLPSIKLYKVFYPTTDYSKSYSWRIPFDDIPVPFQDLTSDFLKSDGTSAGISNIDSILKGEGRLNGVGIKSFRYKYVGVNPAEVSSNIEAELELYFENIEDLVKKISINKNDTRFGASKPENDLSLNFSYSDLVIPSSTQLKNKTLTANGAPSPNPEYYRIRIVCGYSDPPESFYEALFNDSKYTPDKVREIKEAIRSAKVILWLNPFSHDITFQENGSITVKIQYIAALDSIMTNINALAITDAYKAAMDAAAEYKKTLEGFNQETTQIKCSPNLTDEQKAERTDSASETQKEKKVVADHKLDVARNEMYSALFRKLLGISKDNTSIPRGVWRLEVLPQVLGVSSEGRPLENAGQERARSLGNSKGFISNKPLKQFTDDDLKRYATLGAIQNEGVPKTFWTRSPDPEATDTAANQAQRQVAAASGTNAEKDGNNFIVKYVFLGDIFDILCDSIKISIPNPEDWPRLILGETTIYKPKQIVNPSNGNILESEMNYMAITANIAHLPISLNMLQQFFIEKIIKPKREFYPLVSFIADILSEVITPAISPSVFGRNKVMSNPIRTSTLSINVPFGAGKIDSISGRKKDEAFSGVLTPGHIDKIKALKDIEGSSNGVGNYLIIYCSSQLPAKVLKNAGKILDDEEEGIFHFRIGTDSGILKKMNFSKTQNQYQKESMASQESDNNQSIIKDVYDTNITMYGNNIFRPGDYIYIEPMYYSQKKVVDLQQKLGLGGYYVVIDVTTTMNENNFETTLNTVLHGHVEGEPPKVYEVNNAKASGGC